MSLSSLLSTIPSPQRNSISIGPLELRAYGLAIAVGVLAAVAICRRRWAARGGNPDDIVAIGMWAVPAGLVGARLYHVITDWQRFQGRWWHAFAVWEGGLGIPGGIGAGVLVGIWVARRRGLPVAQLLDAAAPALLVAQAIGRLGNWFNQELFGRPTDLPWGLEIDPVNRPAEYVEFATFHPTFLYEALWNLALVGVLLAVERRWHPRPGQIFTGYVAGYAAGRLWVESLRIDPASLILGVRVNIWVSGLLLLSAVTVLVARSRRPLLPPEGAEPDRDESEPEPAEAESNPSDDDEPAGPELTEVAAPEPGSDPA